MRSLQQFISGPCENVTSGKRNLFESIRTPHSGFDNVSTHPNYDRVTKRDDEEQVDMESSAPTL